MKNQFFSIICSKCESQDKKKYLKKKNPCFFKKYVITFKKYGRKNISQEFRWKNIDETRNYFLEEIEPLIRRKHKKVCTTVNYIKHFLFLASAITAVQVNNYEKE